MVKLSWKVVAVCSFLIERGQAGFGRGAYGIQKRQDGTIVIPPTLTFETIGTLTTCRPAQLTWFYSGPPINMTLMVSNAGIATASSSITTSLSRTFTDRAIPTGAGGLEDVPQKEISLILSNKVNPTVLNFVWPVVDIPSGSYQLYASISSQAFTQVSPVFSVVQGPDTSCLATSTATTGTATESPTSTDPSSSLPPTSGASKTINTGAIVGIVLGAIALCGAILAFYLCLYRRKGSRSSIAKSGGLGSSHGWNGLSSTDSRTALGRELKPTDLNHSHRSHRSSSAPHRNPFHGDPMGPSPMFANTSDEAIIGGGPSEEKIAGANDSRKNSLSTTFEGHDQAMALATLPTLHHQTRSNSDLVSEETLRTANGFGVARNVSATSSSSYAHHAINNDHHHQHPSSTGRRPSYPETADGIPSAARRVSTNFNNHSHNNLLPHLQGSEYAAISRTPSIGGTSSATHHYTTAAELSSPIGAPGLAETKKANRNSISGRKRKPVPVYDPNEEGLLAPSPHPPHSHPHPPASPSPAPSASSPSPVPQLFTEPETLDQYYNSQAQQQQQVGHYTTRAAGTGNGTSRSGTGGGEGGAEALMHKSSFGPGGVVVEGKQLHYLIPDLPPATHRK